MPVAVTLEKALAHEPEGNMYNEDGYPIDRVWVRNNTLTTTSDLNREAVIFGGIEELHILSGNTTDNPGGQETAFGDSIAKAFDGFKELVGLLVEHEDVNFSGDFGPQANYVDFSGDQYVDIDMSENHH